MEPLKQFPAHHHGAGQEGAVGEQEVLNVGGIHHRVLLHQVHGQTLCCSLWLGHNISRFFANLQYTRDLDVFKDLSRLTLFQTDLNVIVHRSADFYAPESIRACA